MSTTGDQAAVFLNALKASSLLSPEKFSEFLDWSRKTHSDVQAIAKELNRRSLLTPYQIKEIFKGRGKDLTLGRYILMDLLGEGGMGKVFKAQNVHMGRVEALKLIRKQRLSHPAAAARFDLEMKALGQLTHPNVVTAFDAGQIGDTHFVAMELIDGHDLTRIVLDRGPLPVGEACEYIRQAALGLQHAHERGLVHRDIKPSNILVNRETKQVKLVDLGLARLQEANDEASQRVTQEGFVIGTPDFLSPEQARNPSAVDIRTDIYALGATLYYLITAKVPYEGATATEKLMKHCTAPLPSLAMHRPDIPELVERIIHWCMAKKASDRPQQPVDLALALQPLCPKNSSTTTPAQPSVAIHPQQPGRLTPLHIQIPPSIPLGAVPQNYATQTYNQPGFPTIQHAETDLTASSQLFKLPTAQVERELIRKRVPGRFPFGLLFVAFGVCLVLAILGYAGYRTLIGPEKAPLEPFTNSMSMKMVRIEGGTFRMGSPPTEPGRGEDEGPIHEVILGKSFFMSSTEVTLNVYTRVMGGAPVGSQVVRRAAYAGELPIDMVSYEDTIEFCKRLTERERDQSYARSGWAYRLPTEAEWEYACRAGTDTPFSFGTTLLNRRQALYTPTGGEREIALEGASVPEPVVDGIPDKVGRFPANAFGLHDMHGNLAEWCQDWYRPSYSADTSTPGSRRVVRGGSFRDPASHLRSAARSFAAPADRKETIGFRVVYSPIQK